jgi:tetratricopeptide (TPR) repeat protein
VRLGGAVAVLAYVLLTTAAGAQAEFQRLSKHCADQTRAPDERIRTCRLLSASKGLDPVEYAFAELNIGAAYTEEGDNANALTAYAQSIALEPNMWQAYNDRIELRIETADLDAALDDYSRLVKIDPSKVRMKVFGLKYGSEHDTPSGHGETHEASEYDRAAATMRQRLADAFYRRGLAKRSSGDNPGGDADIKSALAIDPEATGRHPADAKP